LLLKESSIENVSYTAIVLEDYYTETYFTVVEERMVSTMISVNFISATSMR